jgi:hypothetical protein
MSLKRKIFVAMSIIVLAQIAWNFVGNYRICDLLMINGSAGGCPFLLTDLAMILFPIFFVWIISLLTLFLCDDIFRTWLKFAIVWVPLTMLCTLAAPEYSMSLVPVVKSSVSFFMSAAFFVLSLGIIFARTLQLRGKQQP